jgi:hypothetical protein
MIKDNTLYFGSGDILVGANDLGFMHFENVKPPQEIGKTITKEVYEGLEIGLYLEIWEDNTHELYELFKTVNENNRVVKYKDYSFDFSNYKQGSVEVCKQFAYRTVNLMCLAC